MKDYKVTIKEYVDYLTKLQKNIFAILPLYEDKVLGKEVYIEDYLDLTIEKVICVKEIIEELPNGYWYVDTLDILILLGEKVKTNNNHTIVRKCVLDSANLISQEIKEINRNTR